MNINRTGPPRVLYFCVVISYFVIAVCQAEKTETQCLEGYIIKGNDTTPHGLLDNPRYFKYTIAAEEGNRYRISYRAMPPSPAQVKPKLKFYAGSVQEHDYSRVCGRIDFEQKQITVDLAEHSFITYPASRFFVVRHAEKNSNTPNTNLSQAGLNRAIELGLFAKNIGIHAIFVTEFCRTAQTGQPSSVALNLPLQVLPVSSNQAGLQQCDPEISVSTQLLADSLSAPSSFAEYLIQNSADSARILIVGHSDTVPELVERISGLSPCPQYISPVNGSCLIPENEFNHLFLITHRTGADFSLVLHQLY